MLIHYNGDYRVFRWASSSGSKLTKSSQQIFFVVFLSKTAIVDFRHLALINVYTRHRRKHDDVACGHVVFVVVYVHRVVRVIKFSYALYAVGPDLMTDDHAMACQDFFFSRKNPKYFCILCVCVKKHQFLLNASAKDVKYMCIILFALTKWLTCCVYKVFCCDCKLRIFKNGKKRRKNRGQQSPRKRRSAFLRPNKKKKFYSQTPAALTNVANITFYGFGYIIIEFICAARTRIDVLQPILKS